MIKIEKTLLFIIVLVLLVGAVSATENLQEDQSSTIDETVASDISIVSQDNKIINNEEKKVLDENPQKNVEYTTHNIEKKSDNNLKKEGIVEVHNYTELQSAVTNASSAGADTTIRLLQGSYNNTGTIGWNTGGRVLTIDGNGQTINGHQQRVFHIASASMILKNITITNATGSGAVFNNFGTFTVIGSTFTNNSANKDGGAINNQQGILTITNSTFINNSAVIGGAINDNSNGIWANITSSNFITNTANQGAAIYAHGWVNLTNNTFKENTATDNNETIDLYGYWNGLFEGNTYESTDIALNEISLNLKDDQSIYATDEDVILNFTVQPTHTNYYYDYETGIQDITLYINGQKNITTKYENYTLSGLELGEYEVYYTTCNQQSNTVTFKVIGDAEVNVTNYTQLVQAIANATREEYNIYKINLQLGDYNATTSINWENSATKKIIINGNNNTLNGQNTHQFIKINSGHNLTLENITITNYTSGDGGSIYNYYGYLTITNSKFTNNIGNSSGGVIYDNSGTLNVINSTFTNNQAKQGGAIYKVFGSLNVIDSTFNNNQGYVKGGAIFVDIVNILTNITSSNFINNTAPIGGAIYDAGGWINLTNNTFKENTATDNKETIDLYGWWNGLFEDNIYESNQNTTSGILTDNTLTPGDYTITVQYPETDDYKESQTTIDFTVEIDKDAKIAELEEQVENLTEKLEQANEKIENLTNQLEQANNEIETLNNTISNLTTQLEDAENKINTLNNTIENITQQLEQAQEEIETLNNTNNNLTRQLEEANQKIDSLNNQISNLTQKIKEKDNQIENLTEQITDLTKQLQDAQKEIQTLTQENNNLNNQLEQAQQTIKTLNNTIKELTRPPLNTTITITPIKSSVGSIVNLSAHVKDQNGEKVSGGKVIFKVNGITLKDEYNNVLYATLTDGCASLKYKVQSVWMKNTSYVEAVYGGNENYTSSRTKSSNILNITEGTAKVSLDKSSFTVKSGETITLRAKIVDANGDNINRGKVVFKLNGKTLTDKNGKTLQANVAGGEAVLEYTIPSTYSSRTYNLTAVYGGEGYTRSQTSGKLTINKKGVIINTDSITTKNNKTTIKATITDETGELLVRNTSLAIKVNGITILTGVNSTNGKIDLSFTTTFRPGMYELQIISGENGIYKTGKMTTVLKI